MAKIKVQDTQVTVISHNENDYISLTDIAKYKSDDPTATVANWMRNRNTIEYLGIWESLYNPSFNHLEFEGLRKEAGLNAFTMSPQKWINATNAIGIISKAGRYKTSMPYLSIKSCHRASGLIKLNQIAIQQMRVLEDVHGGTLLQ